MFTIIVLAIAFAGIFATENEPIGNCINNMCPNGFECREDDRCYALAKLAEFDEAYVFQKVI
ncbi:hypothetical protein Tcan_04568 [Toxocara canis]|uniref:Uncharacterized protein n=1 Tax=Toxocara canis TaxID=6265 RepID=A0A0B2V727_TOXCA|nr:hypothetical protein Tcan_04568 [Toxocara canis]